MNVLAHLHLATLAHSSLLGNVMADFVKGDPFKQYPMAIAQGIMLHRQVDHLTDHATQVKHALSLFAPPYRRVAGIVLDIVWDHFLANNWSQWQSLVTLSQFVYQVKVELAPQMVNAPLAFQHFMQHLWQQTWLERYAELDFIEQVLRGMARRHPKLPPLHHTMPTVRQHYLELDLLFTQLYPQLQQFALTHQPTTEQ